MATYQSAADQYVTVGAGGVRYAYRWVGSSGGVPLVMLPGFRNTMDHWDPALVNAIAASRRVLLLDNPGVGRSSGPVPRTYKAWAQCIAAVAATLGLASIDVLGYSMGGCVAQLLALHGGGLVRRLVLAGTTPSIGPEVRQYSGERELAAFGALSAATTREEHRRAFLAGSFAPTPRSQAAGAEAWARIVAGRPGRERADYLGREGARNQGIAFAKFMDPKQAEDASFDRLGELKIPVLVASGKDDLLLPAENNIILYQKLSNAHLHFYPDSGHGFLFQYAEDFGALVGQFLTIDTSNAAESKL